MTNRIGSARGDRLEQAAHYHSILEHFAANDVEQLPPALRALLTPLEIALSDSQPSDVRVRAAWIDDWWFTWIEGHGLVHVRGNEASTEPDYVLLALALSGRNSPTGALEILPRPGEMILMPWRAPAGIVSAGEFRYLIVHIPAASLERHRREGIEIPFNQPVTTLVGAGAVLAAALRSVASEARRSINRFALGMILPELVQLTLRALQAQAESKIDLTSPVHRVDRILSYLEAHLGDEWLSSQQVARACGLSRRQLFRSFAAADQNFAATLRRMRIERATELLVLSPAMPIAEVALACGFSGSAQFCRVFRAAVGSRPTAYRRSQLTYRTERPSAGS